MKSNDNTGVKPKQKRGKKVMMVLGIILSVITVCMLIGSILHATYFASKKEEIEPYGQMCDVYDGQMHVCKARIGDQAKYEILDGTHFIYLNNVDRISEITDEFLRI